MKQLKANKHIKLLFVLIIMVLVINSVGAESFYIESTNMKFEDKGYPKVEKGMAVLELEESPLGMGVSIFTDSYLTLSESEVDVLSNALFTDNFTFLSSVEFSIDKKPAIKLIPLETNMTIAKAQQTNINYAFADKRGWSLLYVGNPKQLISAMEEGSQITFYLKGDFKGNELSFSATFNYNKEEFKAKDYLNSIEVTTNDLFSEFGSNSLRAKNKYSGKNIITTFKVRDITENFYYNKSFIEDEIAPYKYEILGPISYSPKFLQFNVYLQNNQEKLFDINIGEYIKVKGQLVFLDGSQLCLVNAEIL